MEVYLVECKEFRITQHAKWIVKLKIMMRLVGIH
jgi:hypothetical protein